MLPKRKSNSIETDAGRFRYIVSEVSQEGNDVTLTVNIQSESNGSVLRVNGLIVSRLPLMESKYYVGRSLQQSVLPHHISALFESGISDGWNPNFSGPVFILKVTNSEVFGSNS